MRSNTYLRRVVNLPYPVLMLVTLLVFVLTPGGHSQTADMGNDDCLSCHEDFDKALSTTSHRLSTASDAKTIIKCSSCHSGGERHIDDPSSANISNPMRQPVSETEKVCAECHQPHKGMGASGFDPHAGQNIGCTSCHRIHAVQTSLLSDANGGVCGACHQAAVNDFRHRSSHPISDGILSCISCHDVTGKNNVNFGHGANSNCYQCHPEQAGPFLHEHEAVSSFGTEGEGCIGCHRPHGSVNDRLMAQPGDRICLQCHAVPPLHKIRHEGIATQYECVECHSDIHGSYTSRMFLDPQLSNKIGGAPLACFCHDSNDGGEHHDED